MCAEFYHFVSVYLTAVQCTIKTKGSRNYDSSRILRYMLSPTLHIHYVTFIGLR